MVENEVELMLQWTNDRARCDLVLDHLDKALGVNEQGEVTLGWAPGVTEALSEIVAECIAYSPELSPSRRRSVTWRALIDSKKAGDFTHKGILDSAAQKQTEFLRSPRQPFVMLTSATVAYEDHLQPIRLDDATISFLPHRPADFAPFQSQGRNLEYKIQSRQTHITVALNARDALEAAETAFDRLLLWRGIWNLFVNRRSGMRISFGGGASGHPVNQIVPGPLHTMHHPDGKVALTGQWWHSPGLEDVRPESLGATTYARIKKFEKWVRRRLENAAIAPETTRLLMAYCSALDEPELSSAYLALWGVLEQITGTDKRSYEDLLRRASFLYRDAPFARVLLEHLRDTRNRMVHRGQSIDDPERMVYLLKRYVEDELIFLLRNARRFRRMDEFRSLLDLPPDLGELRERLRMHRWAHGLHEKWRKAAEAEESSEAKTNGEEQMERYRSKEPLTVEWEVGQQTGRVQLVAPNGKTFVFTLGKLDATERTKLVGELEKGPLFQKVDG